MLNLGQRYYEITSKEIKFFTKNLAYSLNKIQGIRVIGNPENLLNVVAFTSDSHDIYSINEHLQKCGWNLNPLQFPSAIHLCITENHTSKEKMDDFLNCVKESLKEIPAKRNIEIILMHMIIMIW